MYLLQYRGYYFYYSSSQEEPMGFTANPNIFLFNADIFDCHLKSKKSTYCQTEDLDDHRVSFYTSLYRNFLYALPT